MNGLHRPFHNPTLLSKNETRFTKLPPGFTHEIKIHLGEHGPAINPVTGVPIMEFEKYCCGE